MPCAYVIIDMKVTDPLLYQQYLATAPAAVKAAGGEYVVRGGHVDVLEGDWQPARLVMLRFPSLQAATAFYDSDMYCAARATRLNATEFFDMIVVEGLPSPV